MRSRRLAPLYFFGPLLDLSKVDKEIGYSCEIPKVSLFMFFWALLNLSKVYREIGYSYEVQKISPFVFLWAFS